MGNMSHTQKKLRQSPFQSLGVAFQKQYIPYSEVIIYIHTHTIIICIYAAHTWTTKMTALIFSTLLTLTEKKTGTQTPKCGK